MNAELLSPEIEAELESQEIEEKITREIEREIECPHCHDVMELSSDFKDGETPKNYPIKEVDTIIRIK
jgi:hypothetical protein